MSCSLRIENVAWGPTRDRRIIEDVSFDVPPGSVTVIVGANGAGKSSLLRCIYRAHRPLTGEILLDGDNVWQMRPQAVAKKIAAVLQEAPADFPFTVREVVEMGRTPHLKGLFASAGDEDRLVDTMMDRFELNSLAPQQFTLLSGGEKQRALLARALVQEPGLIVLDEPTNHLDIRHQLEIIQELRRLDMTVLTTLHDLTLAASIADQIVVMERGRVAACGTPDAVLTPQIIRTSFDVAADVDRHHGRMRFAFSLPERSMS